MQANPLEVADGTVSTLIVNRPGSFRRWMDLVLFQLCWFGAVIGVNLNRPLLGPLLVLGSLFLHHLFLDDWTRELLFILLGGTGGYLLDGLLMNLGVLKFPGFGTVGVLPPLWLFTQWLIFCSLFHTTLDWMLSRPRIGALLGAGGGPLSYAAAQRLGALTLGPNFSTALLLLALLWAGIVPGLCYFARHLRWNQPRPHDVS